MKAVSVIIPVYNTALYVKEAVESVLQQTLHDLEVIAVDDGSTDDSLRILQQMAKEDGRLKVLTQQNAGQSAARNNALSLATGKYVYFMDSDDILEPTALESCYMKCEGHGLDFCFVDAYAIDENNNVSVIENYDHSSYLDEQQVYSGPKLLKHLLAGYKLCAAPWADFIKRDFFTKAVGSFKEGIIHEDELMTARLYLNAGRVMALCKPLYMYRQRSDSTMGLKFSERNLRGYYTVVDELMNKSQSFDKEQLSALDSYLHYTLDAMMWKVHLMPPMQRLKAVTRCFIRYRKYIKPRTYMVALFKK